MARKFNEKELRELAQQSKGLFESSTQILKSASYEFSEKKTYDIFLSHSFRDAEVIHGLKLFIETMLDLTVYVDWIDDPELDRSQVSRDTADRLRDRMKNCRTLLIVYSENVPESKWVPWEVGYFDAYNGNIASIPIAGNYTDSESFTGQEYLGLYSYGVRDRLQDGRQMIWIQNDPKEYVSIIDWVKYNKKPFVRKGA
ncbi:TIR domain-containing protein (plasmid) [Priestia megaterium]|uniref:TIR domain-containing protein n=1 Tax=Priestia megaterium TaxID=1404 RepID=UPI00196AE50A|nr:TIR domain-containing protein [Priestia megaterium]QSF36399.1 TIR domain-containing protein [Priestia megaterium]